MFCQLFGRHLVLNQFQFPLCKDKLIGEFRKNRQYDVIVFPKSGCSRNDLNNGARNNQIRNNRKAGTTAEAQSFRTIEKAETAE